MSTGLASAAFFCFIVSWDEPVIALFLSTSDVSTLPKEIWDGIRTEVSPTIAAIASMLIFLTITLLSIGYMVRKWAKRARE
jgi:putative spermidine/putrescine transport system permease protein